MDPVRNVIAAGASWADTLTAATVGFTLGLCVNAGAVPGLRWLLWALIGH